MPVDYAASANEEIGSPVIMRSDFVENARKFFYSAICCVESLSQLGIFCLSLLSNRFPIISWTVLSWRAFMRSSSTMLFGGIVLVLVLSLTLVHHKSQQKVRQFWCYRSLTSTRSAL